MAYSTNHKINLRLGTDSSSQTTFDCLPYSSWGAFKPSQSAIDDTYYNSLLSDEKQSLITSASNNGLTYVNTHLTPSQMDLATYNASGFCYQTDNPLNDSTAPRGIYQVFIQQKVTSPYNLIRNAVVFFTYYDTDVTSYSSIGCFNITNNDDAAIETNASSYLKLVQVVMDHVNDGYTEYRYFQVLQSTQLSSTGSIYGVTDITSSVTLKFRCIAPIKYADLQTMLAHS